MSALLIDFSGALFRWGLGIIGIWLVTHHVLTPEESARYVTAFAHQLAYGLPTIISLGWSFVAKYRARKRLVAASELPAGASDNAIRDRMKWLRWRDVIFKE